MPNFTYINGKYTRIATLYEEYVELYQSNMTMEEFVSLMKINGTVSGYMTPLDVIATGFLHLIIFTLGILFNVITCIVIVKNPAMRSVTNYYLFSLAVSDIIFVTIGTIYSYFIYQNEIKILPWIWSAVGCNILNFFSSLSQFTSVMMVLAFSTERYLAICHPLSFNASRGRKRAIWIILGCWAFSFICALPDADYHLAKHDLFLPISGKLIESDKFVYCEPSLTGSIGTLFNIAADLIFFYIPIFAVTFLYFKMWIKIRSSLKNCSRLVGDENTRVCQRYKESNRMLITVVIMTFLCWTPRQIIYSLFEYDVQSISSYILERIIYLGPIFNFISLSCTIIHPIIYNIMSAQYREGFQDILCFKKNLKTKMMKKIVPSSYDEETTSV